MPQNIRVGITINFDIKFHANGLQQNIVFLKKLFDQIKNIEPVYIYIGSIPDYPFIDKESCLNYEEFVHGKYYDFDLIILMGCWLDQKIISSIKEKHKKVKIVLMQCGNQFIENSMRSVHYYEKVEYLNNYIEGVDSLWILPQHSQNITYMKTFYRVNDIKVVPCIWDSIFIDNQLNELNKVNESIDLYRMNLKKIIILEPNLSIIKSCLLPIYIVENFERKFPNTLSSCNIIGGKKIVENQYFIRLIMQLDIYKKRLNFLKATDRFRFLEAVKFFGSVIISHQLENDLNYLYFDSLYLNLPLLHNSDRLKDYGYYYPNNDINIAVEKMDHIIKHHSENIEEYKIKSREVINQYHINNLINQRKYFEVVKNLLSI